MPVFIDSFYRFEQNKRPARGLESRELKRESASLNLDSEAGSTRLTRFQLYLSVSGRVDHNKRCSNRNASACFIRFIYSTAR